MPITAIDPIDAITITERGKKSIPPSHVCSITLNCKFFLPAFFVCLLEGYGHILLTTFILGICILREKEMFVPAKMATNAPN